jgi:uncharacterized protein
MTEGATTKGAGAGGGTIGVRVVRAAASVPAGEMKDWGPIVPLRDEAGGSPAGGIAAPAASRTRGVLLHKGSGGSPEAGIWECTPGEWECRVTRDEFCHFLSGRCVYTHESGERTELAGGDAAFFPAGWNGRCSVIETVRKVYMIG